ncbi:MAG TPA: Ku protein, partial [Micromonosporaceae bacterium]|nr:Ku protein [Micromonosporaceae bacterium]
EIVVLTDEDFADLPLVTSHAIDVLEFVPAEQVDPILYAKAYYLEPEGPATKPYVLLRDALTDADRVAIVKVALRQREQLATLRVREGVLVLNTMLWPDEVRTPDFTFLDEEISPRPAELAMAGSLIDSMTGEFDPDQYTDDYRAALQEVIDAKISGREVVAPPEVEAAPTAAVDLMAALRASVERARAARGEATGDGGGSREAGEAARDDGAAAPRKAAKKTGASKSTAAKKTATKSTTTKPAKKAAAGTKKAAKKAGSRKSA